MQLADEESWIQKLSSAFLNFSIFFLWKKKNGLLRTNVMFLMALMRNSCLTVWPPLHLPVMILTRCRDAQVIKKNYK